MKAASVSLLLLSLLIGSLGPACAAPAPGASATPAATPSVVAQPPSPSPTPDPAVQEAQLLTHVHPLTFEGRRSGEGYFSADGRWMIFQSEREPGNPFYQIYLTDLETGATRRVSPGTGKTTCAWIHPDKSRVLFASTHLDPRSEQLQKDEIAFRASGQKRRYNWDYDEHYDIFEVPLKGGEPRNLTHVRGYDAEGSWSPDGRTIVFASNRHAYSEPLSDEARKRFESDPSSQIDIYAMDADGSHVRRLTRTDGYDGGPFFSADGSRICWRHFSLDGRTAEVWTMKADGTDAHPVTSLGVMSWAPYFHPSGDYLIFGTNLQGYGNFELYIVDVAGRSKPVRVTYTDGFDSLPVFTPDGQHLAWTSSRTASGQSQIFMADWNDAAARKSLGLPPKAAASPTARPALPTDASRVRLHVDRLAAPSMDGRLTGTEGEARAADYISAVMKSVGLEPAGDSGTWLHAFSFTAGVVLGPKNRLEVGGHAWTVDRDWRPLAFSKNGPVPPSEVAFAGYGIVAPDHGYDAYSGLDVKDRWVVVFRYQPENVPPEDRPKLARFANLRYKAMAARDHGARGLIVVNGPNALAREPLVRLNMDATLAGSSLPAISATDAVGAALLGGRSLKALQDALDGGKVVPGFVAPAKVEAFVDLVEQKRIGHNVVGRLRAPRAPAAQPRQSVVVGAHYDHLGHGSDTSSLARGDEKGRVHPGADDNASGVAGLLEVARMVASQRISLTRDVYFIAWSGEELGLLGSAAFVRGLGSGDVAKVIAYVNMDMIGRLRGSVVLGGVGSSGIWPSAIERANAPLGLNVVPRDESYLPTDATSFYLAQVPILSAFTGVHGEYHSPRDVAALIDAPGAARIAALMGRITLDLATGTTVPDYRRMEKPTKSETRAHLRAWLGTVPDYAGQEKGGVKVSAVASGGPAATAGLCAGDLIVEVAGHKIDNIYDYTYAIEALKIGAPVKIGVMRAGNRLDLTVTPISRE